MGLIHRIVEPEALLSAVYEYAAAFTRTLAPSSIRVTRRQVYTDLHRDVGSAVAESETLLNQMTTSHDYREGVRALLEKREPNF
jgi:enoyl-CoA hydratase/carnithine racemase